ncbi:hypothetical protein S83_017848 [Arachis hypogaea]|nr:Kinesin-like protein [Arachis hypogaea]
MDARSMLEDQTRIIHELQDKLAAKEVQIVEREKLRNEMHNTNMELKGNIRVFCRVDLCYQMMAQELRWPFLQQKYLAGELNWFTMGRSIFLPLTGCLITTLLRMTYS